MRISLGLLVGVLGCGAAGAQPLAPTLQTSLIFDCHPVAQAAGYEKSECALAAGYRVFTEEEAKELSPGQARFRDNLVLQAPGGQAMSLRLPEVVLAGNLGGPDELRFGGGESANWFVPAGGASEKNPIVLVFGLTRVRPKGQETFYAVARLGPGQACVTSLVPFGAPPQADATEDELKTTSGVEKLIRSVKSWSKGLHGRLNDAVRAAPTADCLRG